MWIVSVLIPYRPIEFKTRIQRHCMRISILAQSIDFISDIDSAIRDSYLKKMSNLVKGVPIKAMLGDTTIVDQTTFDTQMIKEYMKCITQRLGEEWNSRDVVETRDEDIRRIFVKFESNVLGYLISVHISVQFRAFLYYKPDSKVAQIQSELAKIETVAKDHNDKIAEMGDRLISTRLRDMGHVESDHAKLFEMLYNDELLSKSMESDLKNAADDAGLGKHTHKRDALFAELDSLLVEIYNTTPTMIDDARLVTGEDGFLYTVDVERIFQDSRTDAISRDGNFNVDDMPQNTRNAIMSRLDALRIVIDAI